MAANPADLSLDFPPHGGEDLLDQLLSEALPAPPPAALSGPKPPIQRINYSHDGMINLILANPGISQNQVAAMLGYSASWVSTVMVSDAFQARLAERSAEIIDPMLRISVKEQFEGMVNRSLEILRHKLSQPPELVPDQLALRALEISSKAAGYGAKVEPTPISPQTVHNHLHILSDQLTGLLRQKKLEAGLIPEEN